MGISYGTVSESMRHEFETIRCCESYNFKLFIYWHFPKALILMFRSDWLLTYPNEKAKLHSSFHEYMHDICTIMWSRFKQRFVTWFTGTALCLTVNPR